MRWASKSQHYMQRHRYAALIVGVLLVAALLVSLAMHMYYVNGVAQLDLSHPQYRSLRSSIERDRKGELFTSQGKLTKPAIEEFLRKYDKENDKLKGYDAFNGDPLADSELEIAPQQ
ncbi:hypothetical protein HG444_002950 [Candidatus Saccharibacteria bacterium]|nr:hypothetical protein [Candidatus Saccharibacteria bacterium]